MRQTVLCRALPSKPSSPSDLSTCEDDFPTLIEPINLLLNLFSNFCFNFYLNLLVNIRFNLLIHF